MLERNALRETQMVYKNLVFCDSDCERERGRECAVGGSIVRCFVVESRFYGRSQVVYKVGE